MLRNTKPARSCFVIIVLYSSESPGQSRSSTVRQIARWRASSCPTFLKISLKSGCVAFFDIPKKSVDDATSPIMNEVNRTLSGYFASEAL